MGSTVDLLRNEPRARLFLAALLQSSLGTGAGYVALLLVANERFDSPWAISVVLLADLVPAMVLGPLFGAIADRWSRRWCMVLGDIVRAIAFGGIAIVGSFEATVAFALLAGVGTAIFTPSALAALPSVVDRRERVPAVTSLYGVFADLGFTVGPALAAAALAITSTATLLGVNAVTFLASGLALALLRFGPAPGRVDAGDQRRPSLLAETVDGLMAIRDMAGPRTVILGSSAVLFCSGTFNVAELFLATEDLGTDQAGYAVLVAIFGLGFVGGSLLGSAGGTPATLKRRYLSGLGLVGVGLVASGVAPSVWLAAIAFAVGGLGNGLLLVYERLLLQAAVPDRLLGRAFGAKDATTAWALAVSFLIAGALVTALGSRPVVVAAGLLALAVWGVSRIALRGSWVDGASVGGAEVAHRPLGSQQRPDVVGGRGRR